MKPHRGWVVVFGLFFLTWLGWLAIAVWQKDQTRVLSRAQLTAATHLIVADIQVDSAGNPEKCTVQEVLKGPPVAGEIIVINLRESAVPGVAPFPGAGSYFLALQGDGQTFRIAGLPRSPGLEPQTLSRPSIYVWNQQTRQQLISLGLLSN